MNHYQQLIQALQQYPSKAWINRYFDVQKKLLETLQIENDDPRLGLSLNKDGSMPVNLRQRYVLRPARDGYCGCIVPADIDEEYFDGFVVFTFSSRKIRDAKFLEIPLETNKPFPTSVWNAMLQCCHDILNHCRKSGFRKYHLPLLYDFTMEQAVRNEILNEVKLIEK